MATTQFDQASGVFASESPRKAAALAYGALGFRVHPVDYVVLLDGTWESSRDSFKRRNAKRDGSVFAPATDAGKRPLLPGWQNLASADAEQIAKWWTKRDFGFPNANIGLATGPDSGVWVLDVDGPEGQASLDALTAKFGPLPETVHVRTQSGGSHYWFGWPPGRNLRNTSSALGRKLDTRADGGFVVAPPSRGASGNCYLFEDGLSPQDVAVAQAPDWLLDLAFSATKSRASIAAKPPAMRLSPQSAAVVPAQHQISGSDLPELSTYLEAIGDHDGG